MRTKKLLALLTALCVLFLQFTSMPVTAATVGDLVVEGGAADADYRYNPDRGVLEILSGTPLVIRNANPEATTSQRIFIRRDVAADITLAGVHIDNSGVSGVSAISAGAGSNASVTIRLQEGSVNTLKSGPYATPLQKEGGGDLVVSGSGTLIVEGGNEFASSIGASAFRPESSVVIQGGSIFATKFASQPVDGGGSPVFRYVISIPTYPNATVTGMNIAGASFDASGLKTNSNGDLSIFLPDQAGVSGDITLQVGEESVTVPEGQYEVKAPVAVNVEVSGSGQATATPQKMQPSDLVTIHATPDNGAGIASVGDYTRVGKTSWSGPYRESVAVSFGQAAAGFLVEGGSAGSDYAFRGDSLFILSGTPLTISNANPGSEVDQNIEIPADVGANLTLNNVDINLSQKPYMPAINIADGSAANVSISVADNSRNTLVPGSWSAAIQKNGTDGVGTLTIGGSGNGLLRALGTQSSIGTFAAAIGGARAGTANIVIEGGKIFTSDAAVGIGAISGFSANNLVVTGGNLITDFSEQPTNGQSPVYKTTVVVEGGADSIVESLQGVDYGTGYDGRLGLYSRDNGDGVLNAYLPSGSEITGGNVDGTEYQAASPIVTTEDGTAEGVLSQAAAFVGVQDIELAQREVMTGESLELVGIVSPEDATVKNINWSLASDGDTGASLEGNVLHTGTAGTVVVTATIEGGTTEGDFTKNFEINVTSSFVAVEDITLQYNEVEAGQSLELITTITPEDASNKSIEWSIASDDDTGASLEGNVLHSGTAGTVVVTATIMDGATDGDFTKNFEINVTSSFVAVEDITLQYNEVEAGQSLELITTITPEDASNKSIEWGIANDGDTGASLEGNVLHSGTAGTVVVTATIMDGGTDGDFTKNFEINVTSSFVPVEDITLAATEVDAGESLELSATVAPESASNQAIDWSIVNDGDTGAWLEGNVLRTGTAGTVSIQATAPGGATDGDFTKIFDITVRDVFVPVEDITLEFTELDAGDSLELIGTVTPDGASNKDIQWSIADGGGTEAWFDGNVLHTQNAGTVVVTATIMDGTADGHFTKNFDITVRDVFVPVEDISLEVTELDAGDSLELIGTVTPEGASNKSIEWSIASDDGVGAWFDGNVLHTQNAGTVVVTATIRDGATDGDFSKNFDITVRDVFVPVEDISLEVTELDAGDSLELIGTVTPEDASSKSIEWSIANDDGVGAWFDGNVLHTQNAGKVVVTATIMDGAADGNFTKNFDITVRDVFVPVEDITLASTEVGAGDSLELVATVAPEDASNKSIEWGIADGGGTEAWFEGNVLHTKNAGTVVVTATIMDGVADGNFTKNFDITVRDVFVPVEDITLASTEVDAGDSLELVATVAPDDASNKSIEWGIADGGGTEAWFEGNVLHTKNAGTVVVTATIMDGAADGHFTKNFDITVRDVFVPVEDISLEVTELDAGDSLELIGTVTPEGASNKSIEWSIASDDGVGAWFDGNVLHTQNAGTVVVTATIRDGATDGDFTKNFDITVREIFVPVEDITLESTSVDAGQSLELVATVTPEDASNKSIEWSIADGGDTGASFEGNVLHTQNAGTVLVTATVMGGATDGDFTKNFEITVRDVFVPVEDITLESTTVDAGESLELVATVTPEDASNKSIEWSIADGGDTGASFEGNVLHTQNAGTVLVTATVMGGATDGDFTKNFEITVRDVFVPVEDITLESTTVDAGESLELVATVTPEDASNKSIEWSIADGGDTGASFEGNVLHTQNAGTVLVKATVMGGATDGDFTKNFEITVRDVFVPVEDITLDSTSVDAGESLELVATVTPEDASNKSIEWSIADGGDTGASFEGNVLHTQNAGTVLVTATVMGGATDGDFTKNFEITVRDVFVPVEDITLESTTVDAGESLELVATVTPEDASNKSIEWSIADGGDTGASFEGNVLHTQSAGTVVVTATILDGAADGNFTKNFNIVVGDVFVPVEDISLAEDTVDAGESLELVGTVSPDTATNDEIEWSLIDAGTTGATLEGNELLTASGGKVTITGSVIDGLAEGQPYSETFEITVDTPFVPVESITLDKNVVDAGDDLTLTGAVLPEDATNRSIVWDLVDAGPTGATLADGVLSTVSGGVAKVTATVQEGLGSGVDFVQEFEIQVRDVFVPVTDISMLVTDMVVGESVTLESTVEPENATDTSVSWSISADGGTGANLAVDVLTAERAGTITLTATVADGFAVGESFTKDFEITVHEAFVAVADIQMDLTEVTVGEAVDLASTVLPEDATNKTIVWSVTSGEASIADNKLTASAAGDLVLEAKIVDGIVDGDFVKTFNVKAVEGFVPVQDITLAEDTFQAGGTLELVATIEPEGATNKDVSFNIADDGGTDATIDGNKISAPYPGKVLITAEIADGMAPGERYVKDFTLTVEPIPVTDIVLDLKAIESGDTVELEGKVEPENASFKTIVWELVNADTTGAVLDGTTLTTAAGGRVVLKAKVEKGLANGDPFEKYFEIEVNQRVILVSEITLEQDEMLQGETLNLSATIVPADATHKQIKWSLKDAGTTGATLNEAVLSAPNAGKAIVTATVEQGDEEAFVQDFEITVHAVFVAVEDIVDVPTELEAGDSLLLAGTITPDNATNKNIYWAMTSAGTTRSTLIDGTLTTAAGGTVKLTAKVRNGVAIGEDFVKHFEITVNDTGQTPTTPVFKVNLPPSVNVVVGNLVTFTVEMEESNAEEVRYAWYKDGELVAGANEPSLTIEEAADTDAGQYKVVVTNVLNDQEAAAESTVSELRVTAAPIVNYQIYFGSQQTFRGGNIGLMFGTNIPFEKFNSLSINGVVTPVNQYDARPGSTIIEISANYLNMFKNGTYHMRINAVDGFAEVTFFVQRDTEPSETVEVAPITTATVTPTPTASPTETSPETTDPRETTIITYPTTTETTPDITRTGEGSSLIYIIAGIGLLALAGVILILTMRKRRDDDFEDDDPDDRPI